MPADNFDHLPQHVEEFCDLFPPSARLCRIINRRSGTLLDVRPNLDVVNDEVPRVVGNPESAGVQYWLITPYGDGQAIVPVPKDGSMKVRYLTPSTNFYGKSVTVSPFPTSWIIMPSSDCPKISALNAYSSPPTMYESWTCYISWPREGRMLDLWAGDTKPDTSVIQILCCLAPG
ncbi:hypothetical protein R3P38DRAFT_3193698 [Favolaschia claudopus]|uniref:Uncharacterized protein n=1 Tax=Favolaschia claudopus TaxID=2862362 RepID=A0AAW0BGI6_9AGAR